VDPAGAADLDVDDLAATHRPVLAVAGAVVAAVAGAMVAGRGRQWAALSRRYEPPAGGGAPAQEQDLRPPAGGPELWDALDRGEDPTRG